jgi:hypothetical protein
MGIFSRTLLAVAAVAVIQVATPLAAQACACGGFVSDKQVQVNREDAVVELADGTETVTMQFSAKTTAERAAWVMPVPTKADITLGDPQIFKDLERLTRPEYRHSTSKGDGAGGAAPGSVEVLEQKKIGPYEVAQLAGNDATAVTEWLRQNNFTLPQNLADGLKPYLAEGWSLAAMRLSAEEGKQLDGLLPPIRLSFATNTFVYPMRLSGLAKNPQALRLYVLADHRIDATGPSLELYFAGRDETRGKFVTRYDGRWEDPSQITSDIHLATARTDDAFRTVIDSSSGFLGMVTPDDGWAVVIWILAGAAVVGVLTLVLVTVLRRRSKAGTAGTSPS